MDLLEFRPEDHKRLTGFRRARGVEAALVLASVLLILAIGALAFARPDAVFRSPVMVFLVPALLWIAFNPRSHRAWFAAGRDLKDQSVETVTGPVRLRQQARPGLFAGPRDRLFVGERSFPVSPGLAEALIPGRDVTVRFAPHSGALLSVEAAESVPSPQALPEDLSRRERELLALIAEGLTDKEIARRLNLSPATVRTYNSALYQKLGVTSRTQAIRMASGSDLTSVD